VLAGPFWQAAGSDNVFRVGRSAETKVVRWGMVKFARPRLSASRSTGVGRSVVGPLPLCLRCCAGRACRHRARRSIPLPAGDGATTFVLHSAVARARCAAPWLTLPALSSPGLGKILERLNGYRDDIGLAPGCRNPKHAERKLHRLSKEVANDGDHLSLAIEHRRA
jgi:hypothetical protein